MRLPLSYSSAFDLVLTFNLWPQSSRYGTLCRYTITTKFNLFRPSGVEWLHFNVFNVFNVLFFDIRALWRSGLSVWAPEQTWAPECQKIKKGLFDQYGAERFGKLIFATIRKTVGLSECKFLTALQHIKDHLVPYNGYKSRTISDNIIWFTPGSTHISEMIFQPINWLVQETQCKPN